MKKAALSLLTIAIVICGAIAVLHSTVVRQLARVYFTIPQRYVGWVVSSGIHGTIQWHVTTEKIAVVGKPYAALSPFHFGGSIYSDYYPPGTKLYVIPGVSKSKAIAVQQSSGSYLLAVHQGIPSETGIAICDGWVEPAAKHTPGHYKVTSDGRVPVSHIIGRVGTNFTSAQIPNGTAVYAVRGINPRMEIAVAYPNGFHVKAVWVPDPLYTSH